MPYSMPGQMAESKDSIAIVLPDCGYESLLEMFRSLGDQNEFERKLCDTSAVLSD